MLCKAEKDKNNRYFINLLLAGIVVLASCKQKSGSNYKMSDAEMFSAKLQQYKIIDEMAVEALMSYDTVSQQEYLKTLKETVLPDWVDCVDLMDESKNLVISLPLKEDLRAALKLYASHRIEETKIMIRMYEEKEMAYKKGLDSMRQLIIQAKESIIQKERLLQMK